MEGLEDGEAVQPHPQTPGGSSPLGRGTEVHYESSEDLQVSTSQAGGRSCPDKEERRRGKNTQQQSRAELLETELGEWEDIRYFARESRLKEVK